MGIESDTASMRFKMLSGFVIAPGPGIQWWQKCFHFHGYLKKNPKYDL